MVVGLATTTVTIYRATGTNAWGDESDDDISTPYATGVPVSILEQSRDTKRFVDDRPGTVRSNVGRIARGKASIGDRWLDEKTGFFYVVTEVHRNQNPIMGGDLVCTLDRYGQPRTSTMGGTMAFTIGN